MSTIKGPKYKDGKGEMRASTVVYTCARCVFHEIIHVHESIFLHDTIFHRCQSICVCVCV